MMIKVIPKLKKTHLNERENDSTPQVGVFHFPHLNDSTEEVTEYDFQSFYGFCHGLTKAVYEIGEYRMKGVCLADHLVT